MGKDTQFRYKFAKWGWTSLNPDFIKELLFILENDLKRLNVNILEPEEFITLIVGDEKARNKLKIDLGINLHENEIQAHQKEVPILNIHELKNEEPEIQELENKKWLEFWK